MWVMHSIRINKHHNQIKVLMPPSLVTLTTTMMTRMKSKKKTIYKWSKIGKVQRRKLTKWTLSSKINQMIHSQWNMANKAAKYKMFQTILCMMTHPNHNYYLGKPSKVILMFRVMEALSWWWAQELSISMRQTRERGVFFAAIAVLRRGSRPTNPTRSIQESTMH